MASNNEDYLYDDNDWLVSDDGEAAEFYWTYVEDYEIYLKENDDGTRDEESFFEESVQLVFPELTEDDIYDEEGNFLFPDCLDLKMESSDLLDEYLDELADLGDYGWLII